MQFLFLILFSLPVLALKVPLDPAVEPPALLSETGVLTQEAVDYSINQPLWVDFAAKQRRMILPEGGKVQFSATGDYKFPVGTVFVKHFKMEVSKGKFQNIETRILVRKTGEAPENWVGYTYQWEGSDATLVTGRFSPEVTIEVDSTAEGGARSQKFKIPSRSQCLQCHNDSVGFVRSFNTRQLNRDGQLDSFSDQGIFTEKPWPSSFYEKFASVTDETADLEQRTRAYLDVNCAHCHNPSESAPCSFTGLDFRFDHFNPEMLVASGHLVKGDKAASEIFLRMSSEQRGQRMPFIGSALRDEAALSTVGRWIDSLH